MYLNIIILEAMIKISINTLSLILLKESLSISIYQPKIIQTNNKSKFTYTSKTGRVHPLDTLLNQLNITHQFIKPKTPGHNRKVERSNNIPIQVLS